MGRLDPPDLARIAIDCVTSDQVKDKVSTPGGHGDQPVARRAQLRARNVGEQARVIRDLERNAGRLIRGKRGGPAPARAVTGLGRFARGEYQELVWRRRQDVYGGRC